MNRYLRGYRRRKYVGTHRGPRLAPMVDPWEGAPLFPQWWTS